MYGRKPALADLLKYQPCDELGPKMFLPHIFAIVVISVSENGELAVAGSVNWATETWPKSL